MSASVGSPCQAVSSSRLAGEVSRAGGGQYPAGLWGLSCKGLGLDAASGKLRPQSFERLPRRRQFSRSLHVAGAARFKGSHKCRLFVHLRGKGLHLPGEFVVFEHGDRLAGLNRFRHLSACNQATGNRHINVLYLCGLQQGRPTHSARQRDQADNPDETCRKSPRNEPPCALSSARRHRDSLPQILDRLVDHAQERHCRNGVGHGFQPHGAQDAVQKTQDRKNNNPPIHDRHEPVDPEKHGTLLRQASGSRLPKEGPPHQPGEHRTASLPEIRNSKPVGKKVVAVITEQWVAVQEECVHRAEKQNVQRQGPNQPVGSKSPHKRGKRRQKKLHVDTGLANGHPLTFVRQGPRIGHVAVEARSEHKQENPDLVAVASIVAAGHGVPQFVEHLHHRKAKGQANQIDGPEEGLHFRKPARQIVGVNRHGQECQEHDHRRGYEPSRTKHPCDQRIDAT